MNQKPKFKLWQKVYADGVKGKVLEVVPIIAFDRTVEGHTCLVALKGGDTYYFHEKELEARE